MKILLANKFFHLRGGAERVLFQERRYLLDQGHEVLDFAMHHPDNLPSPQDAYFTDHVDYHAPGPWTRKAGAALAFIHSRQAVSRIRALVMDHGPHLAHLHNVYHQLTPAIIPALKAMGVPVVLTLHDYKVVCPAYRMLDGRDRPCRRCVGGSVLNAVRHGCGTSLPRSVLLAAEALWHRLRGSYAHVDALVAPSRFMARMAEAGGIPADRIHILANGVAPRSESEAARDSGYALFLGRLSGEKGVSTLLQAHAQAPHIPLRIAGDGPLRAALQLRFPTARFLGHMDGEALEEQLRGAALVVVPSEFYENCSLSVLEAMAQGKAVLASDIGGVPEQITHGHDGMLFQPGNVRELHARLTALWSDPPLRERLGREALRTVRERFTLDAHCKGLRALYDRVLDRRTA